MKTFSCILPIFWKKKENIIQWRQFAWNILQWIQFAWNNNGYFLEKKKKIKNVICWIFLPGLDLNDIKQHYQNVALFKTEQAEYYINIINLSLAKLSHRVWRVNLAWLPRKCS